MRTTRARRTSADRVWIRNNDVIMCSPYIWVFLVGFFTKTIETKNAPPPPPPPVLVGKNIVDFQLASAAPRHGRPCTYIIYRIYVTGARCCGGGGWEEVERIWKKIRVWRKISGASVFKVPLSLSVFFFFHFFFPLYVDIIPCTF